MNDDEFLGGVRELYDLKGEASMSSVVGMLYAAVIENKPTTPTNYGRYVARRNRL
jgi:hypothetical protein